MFLRIDVFLSVSVPLHDCLYSQTHACARACKCVFLLKMNMSLFCRSNNSSNHPLPLDTSALCQILVSRHWLSLKVEGIGTAGIGSEKGRGGDYENEGRCKGNRKRRRWLGGLDGWLVGWLHSRRVEVEIPTTINIPCRTIKRCPVVICVWQCIRQLI